VIALLSAKDPHVQGRRRAETVIESRLLIRPPLAEPPAARQAGFAATSE